MVHPELPSLHRPSLLLVASLVYYIRTLVILNVKTTPSRKKIILQTSQFNPIYRPILVFRGGGYIETVSANHFRLVTVICTCHMNISLSHLQSDRFFQQSWRWRMAICKQSTHLPGHHLYTKPRFMRGNVQQNQQKKSLQNHPQLKLDFSPLL